MKKFLLCSVMIFAAAILTGVGVLAFIYNAQKLDINKLTPHASTVQIYDDTDTIIPGANDYNSVSADELPEHVKWSFICIEDKNFYKHSGISYNRIAKAAFKNVRAGATKEGASTISQQLIKNTHLSHEKTLKRKIREAALAHKLEKKYSKNEILEMYLNAVYFGNGIYGLEAASRFYYNKSANELTVRESAGLAGILRNPVYYDPVSRVQNFSDRTDFVLGTCLAQNRINNEQYELAKKETITIHGKRAKNDAAAYRHAAIAQSRRLIGDLKAHKIYTFFDADTQISINETIKNPGYQIQNLSDRNADACIIAATPQGHIQALHTNNHIIMNGRRNFASALKPLAVFAPAIELGVVEPCTVISDEPYISGDFHPRNHDNRFRGDVTVRESLAHSYNIPSVKILEYTRLNRAVDVAKSLGLTMGDENLGLALGTTQQGTSFLELLGGYCALANEGLKTVPSFVKRIENADGKVVWKYTEPHMRVLSRNTCLTVSDMLCYAAKEGTARKLASLDFDIAAKTGTAERSRSSTNTDASIIAYTPSKVLLVWHGNADMSPANDLASGTTGGSVTSYIARDIMRSVTKNPLYFTRPLAQKPTVTLPKTGVEKLVLHGKIGDAGMPELRFHAYRDKTYEIHRRIGANTSLLEVIKKHEGEYNYTDRNAIKDKVTEYWVISGEVKSECIKIFCTGEVNRNVNVGKRSGGKHWFF